MNPPARIRMPMNPTRRDFLIRYARWGGLAALGAVAARLAWTGRDGACPTAASPCGSCQWLGRCVLPKAVSAKQDSPPAR
jgi:hypothetical protein